MEYVVYAHIIPVFSLLLNGSNSFQFIHCKLGFFWGSNFGYILGHNLTCGNREHFFSQFHQLVNEFYHGKN